MTKLTSFTAFLLLLLCFSSFLFHGFSRPISHESSSDSSDAAIVDGISSLQTAVKEDWWFYGGFPPKSQWPFVHPPLPSGGFKWPPKKWPFVYPPIPAGGNWPFVKPPFPCPWWPKKGFENVENGAKESDAAAPSPLAA